MYSKTSITTILLTTYLVLNAIVVKTTHSWKYQTKCTKVSKNSILHNTNNEFQTDVASSDNSYSIVDDFDHINTENDELSNKMQLKCPNANDFLFIGLTQYGVSSIKSSINNKNDTCYMSENDCLVTVDYLANECNGLNTCNIQLDSQFLHTCKNLSDYLSVAYECIPGSKRIDICSNDETFIVDSTNLNSRFGNFFLTSPNYPNEYNSNLNNCSCKLEYVKIDDNSPKTENDKPTKMNLVFKTYEFDLEEGELLINNEMTTSETNTKCSKDSFSLNAYDTQKQNSINQQVNLCGQYKEFKEFYLNGDLIRLNLTTDDAITRRGFLIEIQPTQETLCPYGTHRFNSKKCIKYFSETKLDWFDAHDACKSKSGRLLQVNDFVDNLKLNNFLRTKSIESQLWSVYKSNEIKHSFHNKCMSKNVNNYWQNESCNKKLDYVCEFDSIGLNTIKANDNNRLIKVSCGSLSTVYSSAPSTSSVVTTTTIETTKKRKQAQAKPIISWSSLIDKTSYSKKQQKIANEITNLFTTSTKTLINDDELYQIDTTSSLKQEKLINNISNETKNTSSNTNVNAGIISQELAMIIAIVCGVSVVLIIINIFCIWNYYNRKLKAYIEKSETNTEANYRTSTLLSRNGKLSSTNSSNNRSMSTVDSYVKILPTYETCINVPTYLQSTTANSSPNSTACLLNNTNEQKMELIKNFFQKQSLDQQHYYETLSKNGTNNYILDNNQHQFDSMVVVPVNTLTSAQTAATSNSTVLLLNNNSFRHLQNNCVLNDLIAATTSIPSPATHSQTKPLITFLNTSTINNNSNSSSDNTASTSCSSSSSPAPAEL